MIVGRVIEVGARVARLAAGDSVLCYSGFRETLTIREAACWKMPGNLSWQSAVCLDPTTFGLMAVRDGHVRIGDAVAVFGMGAIGLIVVQLARLAGAAPVIAIDPLANRRQAAQGLGADLVLDPTQCDAGLEIRKATGRRGVDVAIEYSGSQRALQAALRAVAYGGNVVAGAWPAPYGAGLDFGAEAHWNQPNLMFSRACSDPSRDHPRWDQQRIVAQSWRLITSGRLSGETIVQPVVAFDRLATEYLKIESDPAGNIKLGVRFLPPR